MKILFKGVQHVYCAQFLVTVAHNGNPIINENRDKIHKKRKCFESKC